MNKELTHIDANGVARMVNVGAKAHTDRVAVAQARVKLASETMRLLKERNLPKGDALGCARIGAILAAKKTAELIPLCHTLPLAHVDIDFEFQGDDIRVLAMARCQGQTGVEMEAIVAAQAACAIIYDMCKAVQRDIVITDVRLLYKAGGKSGEFRAPEFSSEDQERMFGAG